MIRSCLLDCCSRSPHLFQFRFADSEIYWMIPWTFLTRSRRLNVVITDLMLLTHMTIHLFDGSLLRVRVTSTSWPRMGRRRPGTSWLEAPLSASSVEMMDFAMFHLMSNTTRVRETYSKYTRRCLVSHTWRQLRQHVISSHQVAFQ